MYYDKHTVRRFKVTYLIVGALLGMMGMWTTVKAYNLNAEVQAYHQLKANIELTREAYKIKCFIQYSDNRIWDSLASEMASSYIASSRKYNIPIDILIGKDKQESGFYVFAKSRAGAQGVGQLMHKDWKDVLPEGNPYDPMYNIDSCTKVLSYNIKKYGLRKGLEIYNVGEGNYRNGVRNPKYVTKVLSAASEFRYFKGE